MTCFPVEARRALIVEDDPPIRLMLETILRRAGFVVESAGDGDAGLSAVARLELDVIILDLLMPETTGFDTLEYLAAKRPEFLERTIITTAAAERQLTRLDRNSVFSLIRKPFDIETFLGTIEACLRQRDAKPHGKLPDRDVAPESTTDVNPSPERSLTQRSVERFVRDAGSLKSVLSRPAASQDEMLVRAELRRKIRELSGVLDETSESEEDASRAGMFRRAAEIARLIAGRSSDTRKNH